LLYGAIWAIYSLLASLPTAEKEMEQINRELAKKLKLCYIEENWAYFTSKEVSEQWGDDWDDAPYEHNAGTPYGFYRQQDNDGIVIRVAFEVDQMERPCDGTINSEYSVEQINAGEVPWLRSESWAKHDIRIFAECNLLAFIDKIEELNGYVYINAKRFLGVERTATLVAA
jgi:hypothetical protein